MKTKKAFRDILCILFIYMCGGLPVTKPALAVTNRTVCETGCDHDTIQAAIDYISGLLDTGTVTVTDARTYDECITMKDGVDLVSSAGATINCMTDAVAAVTFEGPISCNLSGFNIKHPAGPTEQGGGIKMFDAVNCEITGNVIYDCDNAAGIAVGDVGDVFILTDGSSVTIKGNTIGDQSNPNGKSGVYLKGSGNVTVVIGGAAVADKNTIQYNGEAGIRLDTITNLTIDNNTINNNTKAGILLIDVGSGSGDAIVQNNDINSNAKAGINIGGDSYVTIGGNVVRQQYKNDIYSNRAGVVFNMGDVEQDPDDPSAQEVKIIGNWIHNNSYAGIAVIDNVTGDITIDDNEIEQNTKAGISIFNKCTAEITDNEIHGHTGAAGIFTGDWSVTYPPDGAGFDRSNGPASLTTIKRNKIYDNRAGMRLDHASGTINNNLVYNHSRGGIRFSGNNISPYAPFGASWGITQIINNTVADNGSGDIGGGIEYDDINTDSRNFFDPPVGSTTQNPITIKNNIVANNNTAGIKFCANNSGNNRSYNLFYNNYGCICEPGGSCGDCSHVFCRGHHLGRCDHPSVGGNCCSESTWTNWATAEICGQDPLFDTDYTLLGGSPAINAGDCGGPPCDMGAYGGTDPITW